MGEEDSCSQIFSPLLYLFDTLHNKMLKTHQRCTDGARMRTAGLREIVTVASN